MGVYTLFLDFSMWQNYTFPRFLNEKLQKKFFITTLTVKFLYTAVKKLYAFCKTLFYILLVFNDLQFGMAVVIPKGRIIIIL